MNEPDPVDILDVLACDINARPKHAPSIFDLSPHIEKVERLPVSITISFRPAAAADVRAFVEAERLCCAGIDWQLQLEPAVRLTIGASPSQLDGLQQMFEQT